MSREEVLVAFCDWLDDLYPEEVEVLADALGNPQVTYSPYLLELATEAAR